MAHNYSNGSQFYLNNSDYYVFGKAQRNSNDGKIISGDWIKMRKGVDPNTFVFSADDSDIVPLDIPKEDLYQTLEYKVIYKGNANTKCFEARPQIASVNIEQIYRYCNIGVSTINISVGNKSISLNTTRIPPAPNHSQYTTDCACQNVTLSTFNTHVFNASGSVDDIDVNSGNFTTMPLLNGSGPRAGINYILAGLTVPTDGSGAFYQIYQPNDSRGSVCVNNIYDW